MSAARVIPGTSLFAPIDAIDFSTHTCGIYGIYGVDVASMGPMAPLRLRPNRSGAGRPDASRQENARTRATPKIAANRGSATPILALVDKKVAYSRVSAVVARAILQPDGALDCRWMQAASFGIKSRRCVLCDEAILALRPRSPLAGTPPIRRSGRKRVPQNLP